MDVKFCLSAWRVARRLPKHAEQPPPSHTFPDDLPPVTASSSSSSSFSHLYASRARAYLSFSTAVALQESTPLLSAVTSLSYM